MHWSICCPVTGQAAWFDAMCLGVEGRRREDMFPCFKTLVSLCPSASILIEWRSGEEWRRAAEERPPPAFRIASEQEAQPCHQPLRLRGLLCLRGNGKTGGYGLAMSDQEPHRPYVSSA
jgi:hypothetical protein